MKTISIINLKGGVGKSVTAINMAAILAAEHNKRVLVIDADPQANATRFFGADLFPGSLCDLFAGRVCCYDEITCQTQLNGVDIIPSNIDLLEYDVAAAKDGRLSKLLPDMIECIEDDDGYDYVLIDCPPGFTAVSISGIAASDDVIIPTTVDAFAITGLQELSAQIRGVQELKKDIRIAGILVTMWHNAPVVAQGEDYLRKRELPVFETTIRRTDKIPESTFARQPISEYSRWCAAARDYRAFVAEYLDKEVQ